MRKLANQFPGEIAGASLKRHPHDDVVVGLREFPGEIAGASLKRTPPSPAPTGPPPQFPGEIAGASLKLSRRYWRGAARFAIPRRNRRGLIEAFTQNEAAPDAEDNSPAKSPGPH